MTDEELKAIETRRPHPTDADCVALAAEVRRLRGLVKGAEWDGPSPRGTLAYSCPWCEAWFMPRADAKPHDADCPAFTPDGTVR